MELNDIPQKVALTAEDPFIKYLGFMYNAGIDYMSEALKMLADLDTYRSNLDDYMKNTKFNAVFGDKDQKGD